MTEGHMTELVYGFIGHYLFQEKNWGCEIKL